MQLARSLAVSRTSNPRATRPRNPAATMRAMA